MCSNCHYMPCFIAVSHRIYHSIYLSSLALGWGGGAGEGDPGNEVAHFLLLPGLLSLVNSNCCLVAYNSQPTNYISIEYSME